MSVIRIKLHRQDVYKRQVILVGNLYKGKTKGMIFGLLYSVFGFLLDPKVLAAILHKEKYEMYQVNVLICWISPPVSYTHLFVHGFFYMEGL